MQHPGHCKSSHDVSPFFLFCHVTPRRTAQAQPPITPAQIRATQNTSHANIPVTASILKTRSAPEKKPSLFPVHVSSVFATNSACPSALGFITALPRSCELRRQFVCCFLPGNLPLSGWRQLSLTTADSKELTAARGTSRALPAQPSAVKRSPRRCSGFLSSLPGAAKPKERLEQSRSAGWQVKREDGGEERRLQITTGWGLIWVWGGGGRWLCLVLLNIGPYVVSPSQKPAPPPVLFAGKREGAVGWWRSWQMACVPGDNTGLVQRLLIGFLLAFHIQCESK